MSRKKSGKTSRKIREKSRERNLKTSEEKSSAKFAWHLLGLVPWQVPSRCPNKPGSMTVIGAVWCWIEIGVNMRHRRKTTMLTLFDQIQMIVSKDKLAVNCKTVRIFAYSSTLYARTFKQKLKTESETGEVTLL